MAILPTVEDFPTFGDTYNLLLRNQCQCIWYLPDKGRRCLVRITAEENGSALKLANELRQGRSFTTKRLAKLAEGCCCARHHRNKIWGSGLAEDLADRWQREMIPDTMVSASSGSVQMIKIEGLSMPNSGIGHQQWKPVIMSPEIKHGQLRVSLRPAEFAKHVVYEGSTLTTALLSVIKPSASKSGYVYMFTHVHDAFHGMIKIGYTSRPIAQRLSEWFECGHGEPKLLNSCSGVRHPERVELLTHFQLLKHWYAMRWCNQHRQAHIEWFKTDVDTAYQVVRSWSSWIERAEPYDRRGLLTVFWRDTVTFLIKEGIDITAELMLQIQEVEEGLYDIRNFLDDDMLRVGHADRRHADLLLKAEAIIATVRGRLTVKREIKTEE